MSNTNSEVLSSLDSYKSYAAEYERRKREEEKAASSLQPDPTTKQNLAALSNKKRVEDEIAETLRKIKEKVGEGDGMSCLIIFFLPPF